MVGVCLQCVERLDAVSERFVIAPTQPYFVLMKSGVVFLGERESDGRRYGDACFQ